jgi:hypothetical protein
MASEGALRSLRVSPAIAATAWTGLCRYPLAAVAIIAFIAVMRY